MTIRLHHYIFISFLIITTLLVSMKPLYTAASYNPATDEVKTYREDTPEHIYAHEEVHRKQETIIWITVLWILLTVFGYLIGTPHTKYSYAFYIIFSMGMEIQAYAQTPIPSWWAYVLLMLVLGFFNFFYLHYFFYKSDIQKPLKEANRFDIVFTPLMILVFWFI